MDLLHICIDKQGLFIRFREILRKLGRNCAFTFIFTGACEHNDLHIPSTEKEVGTKCFEIFLCEVVARGGGIEIDPACAQCSYI